jgi:hypothetical protein
MANVYLYHGTDVKIPHPACDRGKDGRDFGRCFYTTYNRKTARDWAKKNFGSNFVVNRYSINLEVLENGGLRIKRFHADAEWAEFVWRNRYDRKFKRPQYDIIIGPMADRGLKEQFMKMRTEDKTFAEIAPMIHYDRFKSLQVCFCSDYAVKLLNLID